MRWLYLIPVAALLAGCAATPPEVIVALDRGLEGLASAYQGRVAQGEYAAAAWAGSERKRVLTALDIKALSKTDDDGRIAIEDVKALLAEQRQEMERIEGGLTDWRAEGAAMDAERDDALDLLSMVREWLGLPPVFTAEQSKELREGLDPFVREAIDG